MTDEQQNLEIDLDLELPEYHGRKPVGMKTGITGAGNRLSRPHGIGDRAVLVVEVKCKKAGHEDTDDGLVYVESMKVVDLFEVAGDPGARLLSTLRSAHRTAKDKLEGKDPIPELGTVGYTDASGVVLTDREVAALRGDPVRALVSDDLTPAVVLYEDGSRLVWPDEYDAGTPRPAIGEIAGVGEDATPVVDLLHHATGESLVVEVSDGTQIIADDDPVLDPFPDETTFDGLVQDDEDDDGGYGDVEDYDAPATSGETPSLPGEEDDDNVVSLSLPTSEDFVFVDTTVPKLKEKLVDVDDLEHAKRLLTAEKQGRGRGLQWRKSALDAIHARIEQIADAS